MVRIKYFFEQSWLLILSSFCFGLLIAVTNAALSARIEQNKIDKLNRLTQTLLPTAQHFVPTDEEIEIESLQGQKTTVTVYKALSESDECVGWSFNAAGPGFADKIELVVAVDKDFKKIAGFDVLVSNETPGFGDQIKDHYYRDQFKAAPVGELKCVRPGEAQVKDIDSDIVAISGATVSSESVVNIISHYVTKIKSQMQSKGLISAEEKQKE